MSLLRNVAALGERNFRWQFAAQSTSVLGDHIAPVALAFAVLDVENSASAVGLVLAARIVPMVLLVLIGGVWADRLPRNLVMFSADAGRAGTQAALAILVLTGRPSCGISWCCRY